ncbi:MAG: hypothetical protein D6755_06270 [Anaerolineae bacterium]|nr:MAG: hypothetical protein D6755_06270 [Anaerolineae bacterium]
MKRIALSLFLLLTFSLSFVLPASAQEATPPQGLQVWTRYPSLVVGTQETISFSLTVSTDDQPETVHLRVPDLPDGWEATFRGGGDIVQAVYVTPDSNANVTLRITPPADVQAGTYTMTVEARGESKTVRFPLEVSIKEKLPPKLQLSTELPTLRGNPNTTFRYSVTLKNTGDEDATVTLSSDAGMMFTVRISYSGKEVTTLPVEAGSTKTLSVEVKAVDDTLPAGEYPVRLQAQSDTAQAELELTAQVTGHPQLSVTTSDGRLSAQATAGKETPITIVVRNNGTALARDVELSSSAPNGWKVTFEPQKIAEIPVGQEVEVTANVLPAEKALAGDYVLTLRAKPNGSANASADFRITLVTSTLWGLVGVVLIAVAVLVVGMAVSRFGRR